MTSSPATIPELDVELCLTSGQVFGWQSSPEGVWSGWDGQTRHIIRDTNLSREAQPLFGSHIDLPSMRRAILEGDPNLDPILRDLGGLRLMQQQSLEQSIFSFLCTQNNHLSRIEALVRSLCNEEGFLSLDALRSLSPDHLKGMGFGYRASYITQCAHLLTAGFLRDLRSAAYVDSRQMLMSLPGIGPKVADCICLYGLHHLQAVPTDTHLWAAVTDRYRPDWRGSSATPARMWEVGELLRDRFGSAAGYAQLLLYFDRQRNARIKRPKKID